MLANQFKQIAELLAHRVVVRAGRRAIVILSHEDVDLGIVGDDELIVTGETKTPFGPKLRALKIKRDDPRGAHLR